MCHHELWPTSLLLSHLLFRSCWSINNLNNLLIVNDKILRDSLFTFRLEQINAMSDGLYVFSRNRSLKKWFQTNSIRFPFNLSKRLVNISSYWNCPRKDYGFVLWCLSSHSPRHAHKESNTLYGGHQKKKYKRADSNYVIKWDGYYQSRGGHSVML